ncbi:MAG: MFS transporter [Butyrivibrio sp.]|nr:MFS transporter [Butyrivibrio sp.]
MKEKIWTRDFTFLMIGLLLISCANYFFASSIAVYAKLISSSGVYAGLLTSSFYFGSVAMRLVNGTLVQKYGARRLMLIGAVLCFSACMAHNFAGTILVLVIFRIIHGIGYSVFSTASGTAASYIVPPKRIAEGMGYYTIGNVLAMALGPAIALSIVSEESRVQFHQLFCIAAVICGVAVVLVLLMKPNGTARPAIGEKSGAASDAADLPRTFLGFEKGVLLPTLISFMMSFSYAPVIVYLTAYGLTKGWKNVGFAFTMYAAGLLSSRLIAGKISDRRGADYVMYPAYIMGITALVMIALCPNEPCLYAAMVILGLCVGGYNPQINVFCISRCSEERRGTATAAFNGACDLGLALGSTISGILTSIIGYRGVYFIGAAVCFTAMLIYSRTLSERVQQKS